MGCVTNFVKLILITLVVIIGVQFLFGIQSEELSQLIALEVTVIVGTVGLLIVAKIISFFDKVTTKTITTKPPDYSTEDYNNLPQQYSILDDADWVKKTSQDNAKRIIKHEVSQMNGFPFGIQYSSNPIIMKHYNAYTNEVKSAQTNNPNSKFIPLSVDDWVNEVTK